MGSTADLIPFPRADDVAGRHRYVHPAGTRSSNYPVVRAVLGLRLVRYAVVGGLCSVLQLVLFTLLRPHAVSVGANAGAFVSATQLNFVLSRHFTWAASGPTRHRLLVQWLIYNATALGGLALNTAAFVIASRAVGSLESAIIALIFSSVTVYVVSLRYTFAPASTPQEGSTS